MKKIAIEEHIRKDGFLNIEGRLKDMDEAGIDMQVLSNSLGTEPLSKLEAISLAKEANESIATVSLKYPRRFSGFATLPYQDPDAAAMELERAVKELGLKGALIYIGEPTGYIDEQKNWPIFEMAEKLDVPIYLHPDMLPLDMKQPFMTYPILSMAMWGFAAGVGLQAMRLMCSGVFDKYTRLKIILGHMGEGIPYFLWRMDKHYVLDQHVIEKNAPGNNLKRKPSEYFNDNYYVTTSGMLWAPVLQFGISVLGADRILFACDYPPEAALDGAQFIESVPISNSDREQISHLNAERLLRL